jgi:membrane-associated protein
MDYLLHFITTVGPWGYVIVFLIIFLESFPPTFFLPGDSMLLTTGFLASQGIFKLPVLIAVFFVGSFLGYVFSYAMGVRMRKFVLSKNDTFWFKKKHIEYTERFFEKYGIKTIIFGRFIAVVRSFAPFLAGAVQMAYGKFIKYSLLGALLWTTLLPIAGFYLGRIFPGAHLHLEPIIIAIVVVSLIPAMYEYYSEKKLSKNR